jgi:hypothetical protein
LGIWRLKEIGDYLFESGAVIELFISTLQTMINNPPVMDFVPRVEIGTRTPGEEDSGLQRYDEGE